MSPRRSLFTPSTPHAVIIATLLLGGFFRSLQFTALHTVAYAEIPQPQLSQATTLASMAQQLAQSFGVGLVALVVHLGLTWHAREAVAPQDVGLGYFTIGFLVLASTVIFYRLPSHAGAELSGR